MQEHTITTGGRTFKCHPFTCEFCGVEFWRRRKQPFCGLKCRSALHGQKFRGVNHPTYKGRVLHTAGYIRIFKPGHALAAADGYVLEHRLVVYEAGIEVPKGYHVHHLNYDRADNRLENLSVMPANEHRSSHLQPGAAMRNQFGPCVVLTPLERKEKVRQRNARRYRQPMTPTPEEEL